MKTKVNLLSFISLTILTVSLAATTSQAASSGRGQHRIGLSERVLLMKFCNVNEAGKGYECNESLDNAVDTGVRPLTFVASICGESSFNTDRWDFGQARFQALVTAGCLNEAIKFFPQFRKLLSPISHQCEVFRGQIESYYTNVLSKLPYLHPEYDDLPQSLLDRGQIECFGPLSKF